MCFCLYSERVSPPDTITHDSARRPTGFNPRSYPDLYCFNVDILWPKSRDNFHAWSSAINGIDDHSKTTIRFHFTQKFSSRALPEKQTCFACVLKCSRKRSVYLYRTGGWQVLHQQWLQYEKGIGADRCKCGAERSRPCIGLVDVACKRFSYAHLWLGRFIWIKVVVDTDIVQSQRVLRSVRRKAKGMKRGISIVSFKIARGLGAVLEDMFLRV